MIPWTLEQGLTGSAMNYDTQEREMNGWMELLTENRDGNLKPRLRLRMSIRVTRSSVRE